MEPNSDDEQPSLKDWWVRWKEFVQIVRYEKEIQYRLLVMHRKQQRRLGLLSLRILKQYSQYRQEKRSNKLQLYYQQQRKLMVKGMKGLVMYLNRLGEFRRSLQLVYCKYLEGRHFAQMVKFKHLSPKNLEFKIGLFQNRVQKRALREAFEQWNSARLLNKRRLPLIECTARIVGRIELKQMKEVLQSLASILKETSKPRRQQPQQPQEVSSQGQTNAYDQLFERKRKFTPIRDVRPSRKTESRGREDHRTHSEFDSPKKSEPEQPPAATRYSRQENRSRLLANLIALKEAELQVFQDSIFHGDPLYNRFTDKLRLELGHYLQLANERF